VKENVGSSSSGGVVFHSSAKSSRFCAIGRPNFQRGLVRNYFAEALNRKGAEAPDSGWPLFSPQRIET